MSKQVHLLAVGMLGIFAILLLKLTDLYTLPETLSFTPFEIIALLLATGGVLVLGRVFL